MLTKWTREHTFTWKPSCKMR